MISIAGHANPGDDENRDHCPLPNARTNQNLSTMGKKSKAKAKAGGGGSTKASPSSSSSSTAVVPAAGASIGGNAGVAAVGGKQNKLKCIRCLANIKDADKARACPGCSDIYCWRCEKKAFDDCRYRSKCVRPMRRCERCRIGDTVLALCERAGLPQALPRIDTRELQKSLGEDFRLDALPIRICNTDGCGAWECYRCAVSTDDETSLLICCRCFKVKCHSCVDSQDKAGGQRVFPPFMEHIAMGLSSTAIHTATEALRSAAPDSMLDCKSCNAVFCYDCIDHVHLQSLVRASVEVFRSKKTTVPVSCGTCYYKAKPCTNPNCPNKVGIPTKRCGGCHIDRYCSVECQAAMYLTHVERCKTIQMKRAGAKC